MKSVTGNAALCRDEYEKILYELKGIYKSFKICECGKSHLKRSIEALVFGKGKETVLYVGGTHGTEWLTSLLLLRFYEKLLFEYERGGEICGYKALELYEKYTLITVPEVNPDGIEIAIKGESACGSFKELCKNACGGDFSHWNANAAGVDINHNFDAGWIKLREYEKSLGIYGARSSKYGGESPESEPETRALVRLCRRLDIKRMISFHSQGEEIYWEFGKYTHERSLLEAKIFAAVSEYTLVKNEGSAAYGGFKDWFLKECGRPAFTVEIGKGENPLPLTALDDIFDRLEALLVVGMVI